MKKHQMVGDGYGWAILEIILVIGGVLVGGSIISLVILIDMMAQYLK